jgi:tRNA threonylcarbamoyladenosine biosynthesis protein TsaE
VVEWAEKALELLPAEHLLIEMEYVSDSERRLKLKPSGQRYREMVAQLR